MYAYVFVTTCEPTKETWVGFRRGKPEHSPDWLGSWPDLKRSIAKFGRQSHSKRILDLCPSLDLTHEILERWTDFYLNQKKAALNRNLSPRNDRRGEKNPMWGRPHPSRGLPIHSDEFKQAQSERMEGNKIQKFKARPYVLISPAGKQFIVTNIAEFARERRLQAGKLREVARGHRKHHKGWVARLASEGEQHASTVEVERDVGKLVIPDIKPKRDEMVVANDGWLPNRRSSSEEYWRKNVVTDDDTW